MYKINHLLHLQEQSWLYNALKLVLIRCIMLKTISLLALGLTVSVNANASAFVSADNSAETKVCVIASEQGLSAARKEANRLGLTVSRFSSSILCNGEDIRDVAARAEREANTSSEKKVALVAKNQTLETSLCMTAARKGIKEIGYKARSLRCNDIPVREFVKEFAKTAI